MLRYRRSPFVAHVPPSDTYSWTEAIYAIVLIGYTAWLIARPPTAPVAALLGIVAVVLGTAIVTAGVVALGGSWRIGQDKRDADAEFVGSGLYAFVSHPIYAGLLVVGIGVSLLDDSVTRSTLLVGSTGLYTLIQSGRETARWAENTS